ncbi:hypothetical protein HPB50_002322 [Hyalomma asiaticum]|uniref:Uncharacterized protein n=1 Tax=Hyalomma asiaticum TaxID=266040 RepID=A0ACB7RXE4_HYAAI|nr:hypothetical protein HPB50_002322 [Hyalomma asiaticum]
MIPSARRCRVAGRFLFFSLFLPSLIVPWRAFLRAPCHLVRPACVLLRTGVFVVEGKGGRAFGGLRVRPAAAVDSGKLRRASQPAAAASSLSPTSELVVARGDGEVRRSLRST